MAGNFAYGATFAVYSEGSSQVIAGLTNIKGVDLSADEIDTTTHDTTLGYRTFVQGLKDGGTVEVEGYFINDETQADLVAVFTTGTAVACIIDFPNAMGNWAFSGVPVGFGTEAPLDGLVGFTASFKVTGSPTLTA
jgi:predicted secreted protein